MWEENQFLLIVGSQYILKNIENFNKKNYVKSNYQDELKNCILVTCENYDNEKDNQYYKRIVNK